MFDYHSPFNKERLRSVDENADGNTDLPSSLPGAQGVRGHRGEPFFIGVAGGTACGKSTVCNEIMQRLHDQCVVMICQDSFYKTMQSNGSKDINGYNFDNPEAFDNEELVQCLNKLKAKEAVDVPQYDFAQYKRLAERRRLQPADVVIVEGVLVLQDDRIRELLSLKIYVDTDDDVRLARRIKRDVSLRGRDVADVIEQYTKFVKPAFDKYVAPSRRFADIIIPWARGDNPAAIELITEHIRLKLQQHELKRLHGNLEVIPSNFQTRGMHTIVRDRNTTKNDFVFYADRLLRLVVEAGLGHLPFQEKTVETPTGQKYVGVDYAKMICGVSIIRSGESMENALRACCKGIKIGKILVHRERILARRLSEAHETKLSATASHKQDGFHTLTSINLPPEDRNDIVYERLPKDIADRFVLLLDPVLSTGHSACVAIQILLEKGVNEEKILFLTLVAAPEGIRRICTRFPKIKLVTSEIEESVNESFAVVPGVGEFADRYFCD